MNDWAVPFKSAYQPDCNHIIPVDDKDRGKGRNSVGLGYSSILVQKGRECVSVFFHELRDLLMCFLGVNCQDPKAPVFISVMQSLQRRHSLTADASPCSPEIHEHNIIL